MATVEEHSNSVVSRYDEFQSEAVENILSDYTENKKGRYLLVIPTGGGKTYTAVKAINRLFAAGVLNPAKDRVVWGAHRRELINQAKKTFFEYALDFPEKDQVFCGALSGYTKETFDSYDLDHPNFDFSNRVKIGMMSEILDYVSENSNKVHIAVVDEAHHAVSKNISYGPLFEFPNLGILGLTATPSRHDGEPLDFEKESFSIGFPDLVERQLILSPTIHAVQGGRFEEVYTSGTIGFTGLEELDSPERDKKIIGQLLSKCNDYEKVIVYIPTKAHVKNLYKRMMSSDLINKYESIDYILGGNSYSGNDAGRDEFIERIKGYQRSIIVNCDVLTEGYDDPTVNTVVMASPTRSKLVYMQAIGRCIRVDKENPLKKAFIVEVEDDLPNIRYRINNRWLFSEISDSLEPKVEDRTFSSATEFKEIIEENVTTYNVYSDNFVVPEWDKSMRYSVLLFRSYVGDGEYRHLPILIDGHNRALVSNWFNFLSERMANLHSREVNFDAAMKMSRYEGINGLESQIDRQLIYEAMEEAYKATIQKNSEEVDPKPWIIFVSFRYKRADLPTELQSFLEDMVNKEQIAEIIRCRSFRVGDYLVKLPLPLASSLGVIVTQEEFSVLERLMLVLSEMRDQSRMEDHFADVDSLLKNSVLPIPPKYMYSLTTIIRENIEYFRKLN